MGGDASGDILTNCAKSGGGSIGASRHGSAEISPGEPNSECSLRDGEFPRRLPEISRLFWKPHVALRDRTGCLRKQSVANQSLRLFPC